MQEKDIIKKLKTLNAVNPKEEWVVQNRQQLLSQLMAQKENFGVSSGKNFFGANFLSIFFPSNWLKSLIKPLGVLGIIGAVLSGGMVSVNASQASVPGDALYPVKITSEKLKLKVTIDKKEKTHLHLKYANNRLQELDKITKQEQPQDKNQNVQKVIASYKKEIDDINKSLDDIKENDSPQNAVLLAKEVTQKTDQFSEVLSTKQQEVPEIEQQIKDAIEVSQDSNDKAVLVMIENHQTEGVDLPTEEVVKTIENKLNKTKEKATQIEGTVSNEQTPESIQTEVSQAEQQSNPEQVAITLEAKQEAENATTEVLKNLEQAQNLLSTGDLMSAFEMVQESSKIVNTVEQNLKNSASVTVENTNNNIETENIESETDIDSTETESADTTTETDSTETEPDLENNNSNQSIIN